MRDCGCWWWWQSGQTPGTSTLARWHEVNGLLCHHVKVTVIHSLQTSPNAMLDPCSGCYAHLEDFHRCSCTYWLESLLLIFSSLTWATWLVSEFFSQFVWQIKLWTGFFFFHTYELFHPGGGRGVTALSFHLQVKLLKGSAIFWDCYQDYPDSQSTIYSIS